MRGGERPHGIFPKINPSPVPKIESKPDEGSCNGDSLPFSTGQFYPSFSDHRLVLQQKWNWYYISSRGHQSSSPRLCRPDTTNPGPTYPFPSWLGQPIWHHHHPHPRHHHHHHHLHHHNHPDTNQWQLIWPHWQGLRSDDSIRLHWWCIPAKIGIEFPVIQCIIDTYLRKVK